MDRILDEFGVDPGSIDTLEERSVTETNSSYLTLRARVGYRLADRNLGMRMLSTNPSFRAPVHRTAA